jgi:hypothetical protein
MVPSGWAGWRRARLTSHIAPSAGVELTESSSDPPGTRPRIGAGALPGCPEVGVPARNWPVERPTLDWTRAMIVLGGLRWI